MCGRYTIIATPQEVKTRFNVDVPEGFRSRYNAAPTQILPVITNQDPEGLSFFHWGLMSNLAKSISPKLINTMAETLEEKASFKNSMKFRRCLIPADGFYEWKSLGKKTKIPYRVTLGKNELFAFAGLWEEFEDDNGEMVHTFTIITTRSTDAIAEVHDRMPVILPKEKEALWLDDSLTAREHLQLFDSLNLAKINMHTVSPRVNDVRNDDRTLINHAPSADQFGNYTLFG